MARLHRVVWWALGLAACGSDPSEPLTIMQVTPEQIGVDDRAPIRIEFGGAPSAGSHVRYGGESRLEIVRSVTLVESVGGTRRFELPTAVLGPRTVEADFGGTDRPGRFALEVVDGGGRQARFEPIVVFEKTPPTPTISFTADTRVPVGTCTRVQISTTDTTGPITLRGENLRISNRNFSCSDAAEVLEFDPSSSSSVFVQGSKMGRGTLVATGNRLAGILDFVFTGEIEVTVPESIPAGSCTGFQVTRRRPSEAAAAEDADLTVELVGTGGPLPVFGDEACTTPIQSPLIYAATGRVELYVRSEDLGTLDVSVEAGRYGQAQARTVVEGGVVTFEASSTVAKGIPMRVAVDSADEDFAACLIALIDLDSGITSASADWSTSDGPTLLLDPSLGGTFRLACLLNRRLLGLSSEIEVTSCDAPSRLDRTDPLAPWLGAEPKVQLDTSEIELTVSLPFADDLRGGWISDAGPEVSRFRFKGPLSPVFSVKPPSTGPGRPTAMVRDPLGCPLEIETDAYWAEQRVSVTGQTDLRAQLPLLQDGAVVLLPFGALSLATSLKVERPMVWVGRGANRSTVFLQSGVELEVAAPDVILTGIRFEGEGTIRIAAGADDFQLRNVRISDEVRLVVAEDSARIGPAVVFNTRARPAIRVEDEAEFDRIRFVDESAVQTTVPFVDLAGDGPVFFDRSVFVGAGSPWFGSGTMDVVRLFIRFNRFREAVESEVSPWFVDAVAGGTFSLRAVATGNVIDGFRFTRAPFIPDAQSFFGRDNLIVAPDNGLWCGLGFECTEDPVFGDDDLILKERICAVVDQVDPQLSDVAAFDKTGSWDPGRRHFGEAFDLGPEEFPVSPGVCMP